MTGLMARNVNINEKNVYRIRIEFQSLDQSPKNASLVILIAANTTSHTSSRVAAISQGGCPESTPE
jgi:hypothetical protein